MTEAAQRKAASLKRLVDRLRSSAEWVWGNKLVEWLVDRPAKHLARSGAHATTVRARWFSQASNPANL